jgi:hypothetical protein
LEFIFIGWERELFSEGTQGKMRSGAILCLRLRKTRDLFCGMTPRRILGTLSFEQTCALDRDSVVSPMNSGDLAALAWQRSEAADGEDNQFRALSVGVADAQRTAGGKTGAVIALPPSTPATHFSQFTATA